MTRRSGTRSGGVGRRHWFAAMAVASVAIALSCAAEDPPSTPGNVPPLELQAHSTDAPARVHVPERSDGLVELADSVSGMAVAIALADASPVGRRQRDDRIAYPAGGPGGSDWLLRPESDGIEDYVRFATKPQRERIAYRVDVSRVAGVRHVGQGVEFLDERGAPRLRVVAPWVIGAKGDKGTIELSVSGCAFDTDPRGPWARPVVAPGAASCELALDWSAAKIDYPAEVDPAWTATGKMSWARDLHAAVLLPSGKVLVVGQPFFQSAELYDPATGTWALTGTPGGSHRAATAALLGTGKVLLVGGMGSSETVAELYSLSKGTWTSALMPTAHNAGHATVGLSIGDAGCATGCGMCTCGDGTCGGGETCASCPSDCGVCAFCGDGVCAAGETTASCPSDCGSSKCGDGVCKNETCATCSLDCGVCPYCGDGVCGSGESCASCAIDCGACGCGALGVIAIGGAGSTASANVDRFDAKTETWTPTGALATGRAFHTGSKLPTGDVLVAGGTNGSPLSSVEIYHAASGTWAAGPAMPTARSGHTATVLNDGRILLAGGDSGSGTLNEADLFNPSTGSWTVGPSMNGARVHHAASLLPDGRVLASGGLIVSIVLDTTSEVFDPVTSVWLPAGPLVNGRAYHESTTLADGRALATGGGTGVIVIYPNDALATAELFGPLAVGTACTQPGECASTFCVDGVCCDQACGGPCQGCSTAKKGGGADGVCEPFAAGTDPDGECAAEAPSTCGTTGQCDGLGACAIFAPGTVCAAPACASGTLTTSTCSAQAACVVSQSSCAPYTCADATACNTACNDAAQCAAGAFCDLMNHVCVAPQANGAPCSTAIECASGFCVDGLCCDSACNGVCQSCAAATKASATGDGSCGAAADGVDPHDDCIDDGAPTCLHDGFCDGQGACRQYTLGVPCGPTTCVDNVQTGFSCNGMGACLDNSSFDCGAYACVAGTCNTSCVADDDCALDAWCNTGACEKKAADGTACDTKAGCLSNLCVDGVCCNAPCTDQCEACDVQGAEGQCAPVAGAPHGARPACQAGTADDPCSAASCDGIARASCAGLAGNSVVCRPAHCDNGVATLEGTCDGLGDCSPEKTETCEPYACGDGACKTSCSADTDCVAGGHCEVASGTCVGNSVCADEDTLVAPSGFKTECAPYRCADGACRTACDSVLDCVPPNVCDDHRACVPPESSSTDSGCSCRLGGGNDLRFAAVMGVLFALAAARCRRRRAAGVLAGTAAVAVALSGCSDGGRTDSGAGGGGAVPQSAAAQARVRQIEAILELGPRATDGIGDADAPGLSHRGPGGGRQGAESGGGRRDGSGPGDGSGRGGRRPASPSPPEARAEAPSRRFELIESGALRALFADGSRARLELPGRATGRVHLEDPGSGVAVDVRLAAAHDALAEVSGGWVIYDGAFGDGRVWAQAPHGDGTEDVVLFPSPPPTPEVKYEIDVSKVGGLRLVGGIFELLDAHGAPRLRVGEPFLIDRAGTRHSARLAVEGCAVDVDPSAPWGRPVVAPGATRCTLRIAWSDAGVDYPAVLDPPWTTTASMAVAHFYHGASLLPNGRVLVVSGYDTASSELYDPATATWAATGTLSAKRWQFGTARLTDGRVLVAGGLVVGTLGPALASSDVYDPATGVWTATGALTMPRLQYQLVALHDGGALAIGGASGGLPSKNTERFDAATATWSSTGAMTMPRAKFGAAVLADGRVLATGGFGGVKECEIYDPATGAWSATGSLAQGRDTHDATTLPSGKVLVTGGWSTRADAEIYDPAKGSWSAAGSLAVGRHAQTVTVLGARALVSGGFPLTDTVEIYDEGTNAWSSITPMSAARAHHTGTLLPDGATVLVAGGGGKRTLGVRLATAELLSLISNGSACAAAGDCASGHCVGGMCCDAACSTPCLACRAADKGGGVDGVCGPVAAGSDPRGDCNDQGAASCGMTGVCDGTGACAVYAAGTACQPPSCVAGTLTVSACSGVGVCAQSQTSCAPYVCASATSCSTSCSTDADCSLFAWCRAADKTCQPDLAIGGACTSGSQCQSGFCVEGVCCDGACNGICQACAAANKTSGPDGICGSAASGVDPHDDCPDDGAPSCNRDGACDGQGACRKYAAGTPCGMTSCVGNVQTGYACNGVGSCLANANVQCTPYVCTVGACALSCTTDGECVPGAFCMSGVCVTQLKNGSACTSSDACTSGNCVDGFCCNTSCAGQCEACDVAGGEGTCVPVSGLPHGSRTACAGATGSDPCTATQCDGSDRTMCAGFVGADVPCRDASCQNGVQTLATSCNETGMCPSAHEKACAPYACGGATCKDACTADSDCGPGATCDIPSSKCLGGASCVDARTLLHEDGTRTDCAPYTCEGSACKTSCNSVVDCTPPNVCNADNACMPPANGSSAASSSESGCGCRLVAAEDADRGGIAVAAAALALGLRRRRRRATAKRLPR